VSTFQWKINGINLQNEVDNSIFSNKSGEYSVLVKSKDGCELTSSPVTIQLNSLPTINVGLDQEICLGDKIKLEATASIPTIDWGKNLTNGDFVTPTKDTFYTANIIDQYGCMNHSSFNVKVKYPTSFTQNTSSYGPFVFNSITYDKSGQYTQILKNSNGCDSIITLNLVVEHLGVNENDIRSINIYPNPIVNDKIFISINTDKFMVSIFDSQGKLLQTYFNTKEIDISSFSQGMYWFEIQINSSKKVFKIISL
jgi:hypothetical protein